MIKHAIATHVGIDECINKAKSAIRHYSTVMRLSRKRHPQKYMEARRSKRLAEHNLQAWEQMKQQHPSAA